MPDSFKTRIEILEDSKELKILLYSLCVNFVS